MILVTGATGNVGRTLVPRLREKGAAVRALTRDAARAVVPSGVEIAEGDLHVPESLESAWDGVESLFLLPTGGEDPERILNAASRAGVRHVVLVSSLLARTHPETLIGRGALHGESVIRNSGLTWTILRPWEFASNTLWWSPMIHTDAVVRTSGGDTGSPLIDPADVAAVAAHVLTEPGHDRAVYELSGPEPVTPRDRVRALTTVLGLDLTFEELTIEQERERLARVMPEDMADSLLAPGDGDTDFADAAVTVEKITGSPARTFTDWVRAHADAFLH